MFGITSAPAIWQRTIDQGLEGTSRTSCILDDIIITGKDDDHLANLGEVLQRLQHHGLRANKAKYDFFKEEITYCGYRQQWPTQVSGGSRSSFEGTTPK